MRFLVGESPTLFDCGHSCIMHFPHGQIFLGFKRVSIAGVC